jgi:malonate-semialdehyde dehydrogenase (acetylating)/methylmalonate-semialdehyde dehydrogenase
MGPVITRESKTRIEGLFARGTSEGAAVLLDGRSARIPNHEQGNFIKPTVLENVPPGGELSKTEIFGPVLSLVHADTVDQALDILSRSLYGNAASIFTSSGAAARKFRYEVEAGNVGVNIGVAAPMAYFPFSGWKDSFLGVMHSQGRDAVEFYTDKKVVIERWPKQWSRKF